MKGKNVMKKIIISTFAVALSSATGCITNVDNQDQFRNALSVSPFTDAMFRAGYTFEDEQGNKASDIEELQKLFVKHGSSEVFVRIATARKRYSLEASDHSLDTGLECARLAAKFGLPLNPEIALFKYYGDVSGQPAPDFSEYPEIKATKPWEQLTIDEMTALLRQYGELVAKELMATGAEINVWDIGNEVDFGIAGIAIQPFLHGIESEMGLDWYRAPDAVNPEIGKQSATSLSKMGNEGLIKWLETNLWPYQAKLMNAVREGILKADTHAKFSTHIALSTNTDFAVAFYKAMLENGFKLDIAGLSFYPSSSAEPKNRLEAFKNTVKTINSDTGLPVFIAEYAYPAYPEGYIAVGPYLNWNNKVGNYGTNIEGQEALLRDMTSWGIKNGMCGIRPWAPELVTNGWKEFSIFSAEGFTARALPVIDSISKGLKNPDSEVFNDSIPDSVILIAEKI